MPSRILKTVKTANMATHTISRVISFFFHMPFVIIPVATVGVCGSPAPVADSSCGECRPNRQ